jgi:hypothetical protein
MRPAWIRQQFAQAVSLGSVPGPERDKKGGEATQYLMH